MVFVSVSGSPKGGRNGSGGIGIEDVGEDEV